MNLSFSAQLSRRRSLRGAEPLLTYYDLGSGERTELSAVTFGNWVDKTANLLTDECALAPGDMVELDLLSAQPGHWVSLVWVAALWQLEAVVAAPNSTPSTDPVLQVVGPERAFQPATTIDRMACRLHPLGLGFTEPLPDGVIDYAVEVRGQADRFVGADPEPDAPAWLDGDGERTQRQLIDSIDTTAADETGRRALVIPGASWPTVLAALIRPVLTDGSAVIVRGGDVADRDRIARTELVDPES